ncbi:hexokinase type 2-like isoform X2 [Littorina saxatilis]|uniref:hexokinase type 2-like isoform X2 n=1 Tax=Littorina saxatilis TaxID=31220 RepID=UPI0038B47405
MCAITILPVCLLFVVIIYTDIGSTDALITCEAGTFVEGKPASISCKFRTNITASKRSINMALYPPDETKGAIGKDILLCRWSEEKTEHQCFLEESNYMFDNTLTDRLTVRIPAVSSGQAGLYMCFFVPPEGTDAYPCELIVDSGKPKVNQNFLLIIVLCVVGVVAVVCCVALFVVIRKRRNKSGHSDESSQPMLPVVNRRKLEEFLEDFQLDMQTLRKLMKLMKQEISKGLDEATSTEAVTKAFPPFVSHLPNGTENGEFLVLDFDGDHLKAVHVKLQDRRVSVMESERYTFSSDSKTGEAKNKLFYFIADCTNQFVKGFDLSEKTLHTALIVAFPCKYDGPQTVRLVKWTKEINHQGVVGEDLHSLLREALTERRKEKWIIVNTELGALGENGCLDFCRTAYDKLLDEQSNFHESQVLEKMVGGRYIGELVRLVLEGLTREGLLFRSVPSRDALFKRDSFSTELVLKVENDTEEPYKQTADTLNGLGVKHFSQEDLQTVRHVCKAVCERAAFLTATSLATLIKRIKQPEVIVVVDGYLYRRHPRFHDLMYSKTLELVKPELKFYLVSPRYERSIGAARIVAASLRSRDPQTANA